jgi:acetolactate synthase-1/2/3 large subunit
MDILFEDAAPDVAPAPSRSEARPYGDPRETMKAADLLSKAERPMVIAGSGIWWDGARQRAENGQLPVFLQARAGRCRPSTSSSSSTLVARRWQVPTSCA